MIRHNRIKENLYEMVRVVGLEPTLLSEPDFESGASTSSTTPAHCYKRQYLKYRLVDYSFALYEEAQIRQQQTFHFLRIHIIFLSVL